METERTQFGRYTLNRMLARGGMGEIYLAHLQGVAGFEKTCVIKKIRPELASNASFVERFLNEGKTLVALTHSNIVQIFDMGQVDDDYYLAMEYVPGDDLRALMRCQTSKWMPISLVVAVAQRVLQGLSYAHRAVDSNGQALGIVHRDISPSNIIISTEGEVKIIDFGIAKAKTIESVSGIVQGKFAYMSPEQARGESLDCRTDIFSLGIVLYEMLTGIRPFEGNSDLQSLERIKSIDAKPIHTLRRDVDTEFSEILAKALAKNREDRYQSADEFFDAIQTYAKKNGLDDGQREIAAYFKPLMQAEAKPVGLEDALDAMLEAQKLANLTTATRTITGKHSTDKSSSSSSQNVVSHDDDQNASRQLENTPASRAASSSSQKTVSRKAAENAVLIAESQRISTSDIAGTPLNSELAKSDTSEDSFVTEKEMKQARMKLRIRYGFGGVVLFCLLCAVILFIVFHFNSSDRADEIRDTLQNLTKRNSNSQNEKTVWQDPNIISEMPRMFQRGIPFSMITDPDNATIYIIEGGYRSLEDKSVVILPEHNVEIAIQAPGYDTCFFQIHFDDMQKQNFENVSWQNCRAITTNFSVEHQKIEVFVSLNPIRANSALNAQKIDTPAPNNPVNQSDQDSQNSNDLPASPEAAPSEDEKINTKPSNTDEKQARQEQTSDKARRDKPADKKQTKPNKPQTGILKAAFKSNIPGSIVIDGQSHQLPAEVEIASGSAWRIVPNVSGRKVAVPAKGVFSGNPVDVSFCEASVRIKESYVSGDPAPYQISDIYIDGGKVAAQKDAVQLVLPCGSHQLEARIHTGDAHLSGKMSISVQSGQANVFSLQLSEEK